MSILTSTCYCINKDLSNNSKSKQIYTFPKTVRFKYNKNTNIDNSHINSYNSKIIDTYKKGTSFGYGDRNIFWINKNKVYNDKYYKIESNFSSNYKRSDLNFNNYNKSPYFSFGLKQQDLINDAKLPGPGEYNIKKNILPRKTIGSKNFLIKKSNDFPGPGHYNLLINTNSKGKFCESKYKNIIGFKISKNIKNNTKLNCKIN